MSNDAAAPFNKGEEVQHKTGGPKMIFVGTDMLGSAICNWMDGSQKRSETFDFSELKKYKPIEPKRARIGTF